MTECDSIAAPVTSLHNEMAQVPPRSVRGERRDHQPQFPGKESKPRSAVSSWERQPQGGTGEAQTALRGRTVADLPVSFTKC